MKKEIKGITKWIKKYVKDSGAGGVVIGLSGGVDSSVSAALAVEALGRHRVFGVTMPCSSNKKDKEDALKLARFLGIDTFNVNLDKPFKAMIKSRKKLDLRGYLEKGLTKPNTKARLRMTTLYSIASDLNYLVIGTENKSEFEIGYFTKFGDGASDFEPLGEFYKTEVIKIAKALMLPAELIYRTPSAGLWKGQTDEKEIGVSYAKLDKYLKTRDSGHLNALQLFKIKKLMKAAKHKQRMPQVHKRK